MSLTWDIFLFEEQTLNTWPKAYFKKNIGIIHSEKPLQMIVFFVTFRGHKTISQAQNLSLKSKE